MEELPATQPPSLPAPPVAISAPPGIPRESIAAAPKVWPSLLAPFVGVVAAGLASGVAIVLVAILLNPRGDKEEFLKNFEHWIETNATSFPAIVAMLVPAQIVFFGTAAFFALMGREPWSQRLGFVRAKVSSSTVTLAVLGTLGVHFVIGVVAAQLIDEPSSALKALARMFSEPEGLAAVGVGLMMSVLPGVCEESLFRGFTQRGLLRRWHPAVAIGVTSCLFALAHFDVQHSISVIPLGAWLGFVAWKTASVWPAALCHFTNNGVAFVVLRIWGSDEEGIPNSPVYYVAGIALVGLAILATIRLVKARPER
jgi:uncharacterized protein